MQWWLPSCLFPILACGGGGTDPGPLLVIVQQPTEAVLGEPLTPPIEVLLQDGNGRPLTGQVTIALETNPCEWSVDGTTTEPVVDGRAVFDDLRFTRVASGLRLVARSGNVEAVSAPVDVQPWSPPDQDLVLENTLCTKPNSQKDAESLEYLPDDDVFWLADDNEPSIFEVERATGEYLSQIPAADFVEALPAAGECDDGDDDPATSCSFVDELEHVAYDASGGFLYVLNTVNNMQASPQVDYAAIFRLARDGCAGCWRFDSWHSLGPDEQYEGILVIDGALQVVMDRRVYPYDFDTNRLLTTNAQGDSLPPTYVSPTEIQRLDYDGTYLWAIVESELLKQVDLAGGTEVASHDLSPFEIGEAHGVARVGDRIYVLDGTFPNPIYEFRVDVPPDG